VERRLGTRTASTRDLTHRKQRYSSALAALCGASPFNFVPLSLFNEWRWQDAQDLDFERLIRTVIDTHTRSIFREFALRLQHNPVFCLPGAVKVVEEGTSPHTPVLSMRRGCSH
jgi:hypothetical protein